MSMRSQRFEMCCLAYLKICKTDLRIRKVTNIEIHAPSCILHVHVPACTVLYCRAQRKRERGRKEGRGRGKGGEKNSAARAAPRRPSGRNLKLKTRAPEQYDHREYCSGALVFNFKSHIVLGQKKWIYSPGQPGTVRDINFRS